jgi:hypothetical protein
MQILEKIEKIKREKSTSEGDKSPKHGPANKLAENYESVSHGSENNIEIPTCGISAEGSPCSIAVGASTSISRAMKVVRKGLETTSQHVID